MTLTHWKRALLTVLGMVTLVSSAPARAEDDKKSLPEGWFMTESIPHRYETGLDTSGPCEGRRSAWLRSDQAEPAGYGTFMQSFDARTFRGQRLRFSAVVRTEDVKGWAGLWMRVEGADSQEPLAFDNMQSRALKGTTPCTRYDVVLDVAPEARAVMAGLMLSGTGKAWIGSVHIEPVDDSVPATNLIAARSTAPHPAGGWGRVGRYWFTPETADTHRGLFALRADGSWHDEALGNVLTVTHGDAADTVKGELGDLPLLATVRTHGPTTSIQGTWGVDPVSVELSGQKLEMRRGVFHRSLVREEGGPRENGTCIRYVNPGVLVSDYLDVCGLALSKTPPVAPLLVAFFSEGFRSLTDRALLLGPAAAPGGMGSAASRRHH